MEIEGKVCKTCLEEKMLDKFRMTYIKKVGKYYYRPYCKKCLNKLRNILRYSKPNYLEKNNKRIRKWYHKRK